MTTTPEVPMPEPQYTLSASGKITSRVSSLFPEPVSLYTAAQVRAYAAEKCEKRQAEQARITVDVYQQDWIPAFAAFLDDGSLQAGARPKIAINIGALMAAVASGDIDKSELPYVVAETMMHEIIHVLESWAGVEFSEDRVDALIEKYRQDAAIDAAGATNADNS